MLKLYEKPIIEEIIDERIAKKKLRLFIKREDRIHPFVSGNKWRKLRYNLVRAKEEGFFTLLTFGGAYSNHIYATAAAAHECGFKSIGIIRGEEHFPLNPTLTFATKQGMHLDYLDRSSYRRKHEGEIINALKSKHGDFYLLPEGGTNQLAIRGAEEIVDEEVQNYDFVCTPVGTGGTVAGIIAAMKGKGTVIGFSALKGDFLTNDVQKLLQGYQDHLATNWHINNDYHFGGYAKVKPELFDFMDAFYEGQGILLDPVYTGKMMLGLYDMIEKDHFKSGTRILAIHTGGLQGIEGMRDRTNK